MECSSCGALYNKSCGCSKGGLVDKFVCDPNKTPDSSQRPPQDCVKCGNPVEGPNCQGCALWRKKLKEVWFTICHENGICQDLLNTYESSDDDTNVVNAPQEPFVVKQDPGENSSQSPPKINHDCCYECGDSLDGIFCQRCTCKVLWGQGAHMFILSSECFDLSLIGTMQSTIDKILILSAVDQFHPSQTLIRQSSKLLQDLQSINEELAEYINTPSWNLPTSSYDDDDDEYSFATQEYLMTCSTAITPDSPKTDSLIMVDKHLDTIPETESDEFIKSSVENLVQNPSESEDECECDVPDYDDSQTTNFLTYSNPLFDDYTSSDNESSHEEEIHEINFITFSNPLFNLDKEINSSKFNPTHNEDLDSTPKDVRFNAESYLLESLLDRDTFMSFSPKIDSLLEEFADELALFKPSSPGINEADYDLEEEICHVERLLYDNSSPRPPEELNVENSIESFPPSHIPIEDSDPFIEEIDLFLASDESIPPGIHSDYSDSEGDNLFLERLLHDDPTPLPDIPSPTHVTFPFEDHHDLDFTCVVRVFLPFFTYPVTSSFLLSSGSEDTIFDPGISTFHFSSLKPVAYENPIVIFLFFCFCPKDKGIRGEIPQDHEDPCLFSILQSSGLRSFVYYGILNPDHVFSILSLDHFVEIPSGESKIAGKYKGQTNMFADMSVRDHCLAQLVLCFFETSRESVGKYEVQTDMSVRGTRWQAEVSVRGTRYCSRWRLANQSVTRGIWRVSVRGGVCQYEVRVRESVPIMGNNEAVGGEQKDYNTLRSCNMSGG
ncbi:hypothetical protein Tco_0799995 [Tanacetum coccineum]|uniref:Uncharacterized protein n=1 Tax=Tanacetum coccineum TaxID=301880 RepID=A0ABQ4ZVT1_9ASTR